MPSVLILVRNACSYYVCMLSMVVIQLPTLMTYRHIGHHYMTIDKKMIFIAFMAAILVVGFVALRPKSTAMVIAGRSVHLTTLFPGQA